MSNRILSLLSTVLVLLFLNSCNQKEIKAPLEGTLNAFIYPLDNIKIDGNLSDWAQDITTYSLRALSQGDSTTQAIVQMGYVKNDNSLIIGLSYFDESIIEDELLDWLDQDSYSFYIDEEHQVNSSGVNRYSFNNQIEASRDPATSWSLTTSNYFDWSKIEKNYKVDGNKVVLEFRYSLSKPLAQGTSIGIDHVLIDADTLGVKPHYYSWVGNQFSDKTYGRLGTVVLADDNVELVPFTGRVINTESNNYPKYFNLTSKDNQSSRMKVKVDENGVFDCVVPEGAYFVSLQDDLVGNYGGYKKVKLSTASTKVELASGESTPFEILIEQLPPPDLIPDEGVLQNGFTSADEEAIDEFVQAYINYYSIPGVSIAIIHDGEIAYNKSYGVEDYFSKVPVTNNTIFEGASMTKPMFAFAVLRLAERGIIDLDKPLYEYVSPPADVVDNPWHKLITARIVLNHQTGFPNWGKDMPDGKLKFLFKPGTDVGYSGDGFTYLRRAVEAITKRPVTDILQDELVDVLDLTNMYFKNESGLADLKARGHIFNNPRVEEIPEEAEMASSVHTNAKSYAEFIIAISERRGLKPETYSAFINRSVQRGEQIDKDGILLKRYYSLGLSLRDSPIFGLSFGHSGSNGDFQCTSTIYEDTKDGFVVMTNSSTGHMLQYHLHNLLNIGTKQIDP